MVTLDIVDRVDFSTTSNIQTFIFGNGDEELIDAGKSVDQITINGVNYLTDIVDQGATFPLTFPIRFLPKYTRSSPAIKSQLLNQMMDDMEVVTLSGMENSNLNTDYLITDFSFEQGAGEGWVPLYRFSITLERKYDQLG